MKIMFIVSTCAKASIQIINEVSIYASYIIIMMQSNNISYNNIGVVHINDGANSTGKQSISTVNTLL